MHADGADLWQGHTARTALTDSDSQRAALAPLVPEPEAVPTPPLALAFREPDPAALTHAGLGVTVGGKCPTEVDRGLLKDLG
jgi:hypothetical protein